MSEFKIDSYGNKRYYNDKGQYHREDGHAVEYSNGTKHWYKNGKLHRLDGPAVEHDNGDKRWYLNGIRHREDGPAYQNYNGVKQWFYYGKFIECDSQEEFIKLIKLKAFW